MNNVDNFDLLCKILWKRVIVAAITWFIFIMIWCFQLYNKTFEKHRDKNTTRLVKRKHSVTFNDEDEIIYPKRVNRVSILTPPIQFGKIGDRVFAK
jgi:hypothetical protein